MPTYTMTFTISAIAEVEVQADSADAAAQKAEEYYENAVVDVNDKDERLYSSLYLSVVGGPNHIKEKPER